MAKKKTTQKRKSMKKIDVERKNIYRIEEGSDINDEIDWFKVIAAVLIIVGIVFLLSGSAGITGEAISDFDTDLSGKAINWTTGILGIVLIIGGVLLGMTERGDTETKDESKLEIKLMDISKGKDNNRERAYVMVDNQGAFGNEGVPINLGQVRKEVDRLSRDDPQYVKFIENVYIPELQIKLNNGNEEEKRVAKGFLGVFDTVIEEDEGPQYPRLDKSGRQEIKDAFRSWDGTINSNQKDVLSKYGLKYEPPSGKRAHPRIYASDGRNISVAGAPSDHRAGMNIVRDMIGLIEGKLRYSKKSNYNE